MSTDNCSSKSGIAKGAKIAILIIASIMAIILFIMTIAACNSVIWCANCAKDVYEFINTPDPDMPEIDYAEFPITITYEVNGEVNTIHDALICEYTGYTWNESDGIKHRTWNSFFESGEYITLHSTDTNRNIVLGVSHPAEWMMGDIDEFRTYDGDYSYYLGYIWNSSTNFHSAPEEEIYQNYGVKVLDFEIAPPIENTFVPAE